MNSPLFRPFPHFVGLLEETKTPVLEWDFDGTDLFFRPQGGDVEIVWTYLGRSDVAAALQKPSVARATIIKIGKAMNARKFWRMWPLKDGSTTFLRGSFGLLRVADTPIMVRFDLPRSTFGGAQKTYEANGARVHEVTLGLDADKNSELNAARRWNARQGNRWSNLFFERGTPAEFERVMTALAQTFLDPQQSQFWLWECKVEEQDGVTYPWMFYHSLFDGFSPDEIRRFETIIVEILESYFAIRLAPDANRGYDERGESVYWHRPTLHFAVPTMHEKLEAQLFLRAWRAGKTAPDNATWLLSKARI